MTGASDATGAAYPICRTESVDPAIIAEQDRLLAEEQAAEKPEAMSETTCRVRLFICYQDRGETLVDEFPAEANADITDELNRVLSAETISIPISIDGEYSHWVTHRIAVEQHVVTAPTPAGVDWSQVPRARSRHGRSHGTPY